MTNNEIIYSEVNAKYHTPEQRRAILALAYTPEQIAAKGKEIHLKDVPEDILKGLKIIPVEHVDEVLPLALESGHGDIFHGRLTLDQLFSARPVLGHADHRMPVPGLYLCGSGAHPGGGVTGAPGHNAARAVLKDLK